MEKRIIASYQSNEYKVEIPDREELIAVIFCKVKYPILLSLLQDSEFTLKEKYFYIKIYRVLSDLEK